MRFVPVLVLTALTWAVGTTAPDASRITPDNVAVVVCAGAGLFSSNASESRSSALFFSIFPLVCLCWSWIRLGWSTTIAGLVLFGEC
jgi:hypothetical protein